MTRVLRSVLIGILLGLPTGAAIDPSGVLVVVNDASAASQELGVRYAAMRNIPPGQICHIVTTTGNDIAVSNFESQIRGPVLSFLAGSGLATQIDCVVFSRDIPYRVYTNNPTDYLHAGLTSTMFYGFHSSPPPNPCDINTNAVNDYFGAERAFAHAAAPSSNRYLLAAILTAGSLEAAERIADRAATADTSPPAAEVHLLHTWDEARSVRWVLFDDADFARRFIGGNVAWFREDVASVTGRTNVMGYMTGLAVLSDVDQDAYIPGAYGDHLTSFAGKLFDGDWQTTSLEWLRVGCAGSFGTVVEPCNYIEKFPSPMLFYWYQRGFSLGESLYMSVRNPYQGLFVGDPLCRPYAPPGPIIAVSNLAPGSTVSATITVDVGATQSSPQRPVARIDLFVDGLFRGTLTNAGVTAGNILRIDGDGMPSSYTVASNDDLYAAARGLAAAVSASNPAVFAMAYGDRVTLTGRAFGTNLAGIAYSTTSGTGTAARLTCALSAATTNLLNPPYPAREYLWVQGSANSGDVVRCIVTLTNGIAVTNQVAAEPSESAQLLLGRLMNAMNADAALQGANGVLAKYLDATGGTNDVLATLEARTVGPLGYNIRIEEQIVPIVSGSGLVTNTAFVSQMNDNADVLRARGTVFIAAGVSNLARSFTLDTTALPDGPHGLRIAAYDGTGVGASTWTSIPFRVANHSLTCAITDPPPFRVFWHGGAITASVTSAGGSGTVTQLVLMAEGKAFATSSAANASFAVPTTSFGAGALLLQARADNDAGQSTISDPVTVTLCTDLDGDGLPDQWEYQYLGSLTNFGAGADPDSDGVVNLDEFIADTNPSNGASLLAVTAIEGGASMAYAASTARLYRVEINDASLTNAPAWLPAFTNFVAPSSSSVTWTDAAPSTNVFRFYRVRAKMP